MKGNEDITWFVSIDVNICCREYMRGNRSHINSDSTNNTDNAHLNIDSGTLYTMGYVIFISLCGKLCSTSLTELNK